MVALTASQEAITARLGNEESRSGLVSIVVVGGSTHGDGNHVAAAEVAADAVGIHGAFCWMMNVSADELKFLWKMSTFESSQTKS
jgi:hypothetical protein